MSKVELAQSTTVDDRRGYVWACAEHGDTAEPVYLGPNAYCPADGCDAIVKLVHSGLDDPENQGRNSVWQKSPTAVQPKRATKTPAPRPEPAPQQQTPRPPAPASLLVAEPNPAPVPPPPAATAPAPVPEKEVPMPTDQAVDELDEIAARHERLTTPREAPAGDARTTLEDDLRVLVFEDVPRLLDRARTPCPRLHLLRPDEDLVDADEQLGPDPVLEALRAAEDETLTTLQFLALLGGPRIELDARLTEMLEEGSIRRIRRHTWTLGGAR